MTSQKKKISILGSTGSIGRSTLEVLRFHEKRYECVALSAHSNINLLEEQAREFSPKKIAVFDKEKAHELQKRLPHIPVVAGMEGLIEIATLSEIDQVVSSVDGFCGVQPTAAAIRAGKDIALACKEVLVAAGRYITILAKEHKVKLIPIDSELSSLFQVMQEADRGDISKLIITASGGPFFGHSLEDMKSITKADALVHPTWTMGAKVTIDSSTLMNKGYETIGAHWLFDMPLDQIEVVVHPQSLVHGMVEMIDGFTQLIASPRSMSLSVQLALSYPERIPTCVAPLNFKKAMQLTFLPPETSRFPCLNLALEAIRTGGSYPCYLNAANETLVARFLNGEISWLDIGKKLEKLLLRHQKKPDDLLETLLEVDKEARLEAQLV